MTDESFTISFRVPHSPAEAFAAIQNVRGWWSEGVEGGTAQRGDVFTYRYKEFHRSRHELTEVIPSEKMVWRVLDAELTFVKDRDEWRGTEMVFEVSRQGDQTEVRFTHRGLQPAFECFDACSGAWGRYVGKSLKALIETGHGAPDKAG